MVLVRVCPNHQLAIPVLVEISCADTKARPRRPTTASCQRTMRCSTRTHCPTDSSRKDISNELRDGLLLTVVMPLCTALRRARRAGAALSGYRLRPSYDQKSRLPAVLIHAVAGLTPALLNLANRKEKNYTDGIISKALHSSSSTIIYLYLGCLFFMNT